MKHKEQLEQEIRLSTVTTNQITSVQNDHDTTTGSDQQPATESGATDTGSASDDNQQRGNSTQFSKMEM